MKYKVGEIVRVKSNTHDHNYNVGGIYIIIENEKDYRLRHIRTLRSGTKIKEDNLEPLLEAQMTRKQKIRILKNDISYLIARQKVFWEEKQKQIDKEIDLLKKHETDEEAFAAFIVDCIKTNGDTKQVQKLISDYGISPDKIQKSITDEVLGITDQHLLIPTGTGDDEKTWDTEREEATEAVEEDMEDGG